MSYTGIIGSNLQNCLYYSILLFSLFDMDRSGTDVMFVKLLEKVQGSLQLAEDKRMAIVSELTAKHQKVREKSRNEIWRE